MSTLPPSRETFARWVHEALGRLYDSAYLQRHPLAEILIEEEVLSPVQRSQNLRRVLLESIRAMRPGAGVPAQSPDWRAYRILELRFIEGLSPQEAMARLSLGKSQFFRDQARVLDELVDLLWERYQKIGPRSPSGPESAPASLEEVAQEETERLCAQARWEDVDVGELLEELRPVVAPLVPPEGVTVRFDTQHRLTVPGVDRVMLRQAVLIAVTYTLQIAREGVLEIASFVKPGEAGIRITARGATVPSHPAATDPQEDPSLRICQHLVAAMGGSLHIEQTADSWEVQLAWAPASPRVLLVVDDNLGFVDLFRRYLAGHGWVVIGAASGQEARKAIAETRPDVITLDVMMPREDGWELLMALKNSPDTREIPVIVCSVLNEPQLALALGAEAYLTKPVTQQALLRALAPWNRAGSTPEGAR